MGASRGCRAAVVGSPTPPQLRGERGCVRGVWWEPTLADTHFPIGERSPKNQEPAQTSARACRGCGDRICCPLPILQACLAPGSQELCSSRWAQLSIGCRDRAPVAVGDQEADCAELSMLGEVVVSLPFAGRWLARNSPVRRIPSHGTDLLGGRYAIDFIGVDHRRPTADRRDWGTFVLTEPAERFYAYGRPTWHQTTASSSRSTTARSTTRRGGRSWRWCPMRWVSGGGSGRGWVRSPATIW